MAATAALRRLRRPTRASVEFALKAGLATTLAIWLGDRLGLQDSYWAGISAVVATAGTLGASIAAALSRISATLVGLLIGVAAFALPVSGTLVAGATVFVALIVLPWLSLDAGARLGAATTLIITAIPSQNALSDALARGANIPLGCTVAVAVGLVLLPHRAGERLRAAVDADVEHAGTLVRLALLAYAGAGAADQLEKRLDALVGSTSAHVAELRDAAREPGQRGEPLLRLEQDVAAARALVEHVASLVGIVVQGVSDSSPSLVRSELERSAETFGDAARAVAASSDADLDHRLRCLDRALTAVDAGFAGARERRATAVFSSEELARLLSVIRCLHGAASALSTLAGTAAHGATELN